MLFFFLFILLIFLLSFFLLFNCVRELPVRDGEVRLLYDAFPPI